MSCPGPYTATSPITARQAEVCAVVLSFTRRHGYAPTVRELGELLGITSTNGVNDHLEVLKEKRLLTWTPKKSRTLRLTASGQDEAERWLREHPESPSSPEGEAP